MWFMLNTTFDEGKHLGHLDTLQSTYSVSYTLTGLSKRSSDTINSIAKTQTSFTTKLDLKSNYTWDSSSTISATGGTVTSATLSGTILTVVVGSVTGSVAIVAKATYTGSGSEGDDSNSGSGSTIPEGYTLLPTTKYALGITSTGTGRVSANNARRFSTADHTKANGILIPAGSTMHLSGLASGTYPLRFDYMYCTGNVTCPAQSSTTAIEGLVGTASNFNSSNYFPMNTSGADTCDIVNSYGEDYYFWIGFAGLTLNEGILAAYDTYTLSYKID